MAFKCNINNKQITENSEFINNIETTAKLISAQGMVASLIFLYFIVGKPSFISLSCYGNILMEQNSFALIWAFYTFSKYFLFCMGITLWLHTKVVTETNPCISCRWIHLIST